MKKGFYHLFLAYSIILLTNTGCKKELPDPPEAPVVKAGEDISIEIPNNSVSLTATTSDATRITNYQWKRISGPNSGFIDQDGLNAKAIWLEEGIYEFEVTATYHNRFVGKDTMKVTLTTQLQKHVFNDLKPNSSRLTEIELPENVFDNIKWVYCRSSVYCEKADAGPSPNIDYNWGGWYFNMLTNNKISIFGGYNDNSSALEEFDLIIYY